MNLARASFTVEASLLMPVYIFTILTLFFLTAHCHNASTLASASCEMAITGRTHTVETLFQQKSVDYSEETDDKSRSVSFHTETRPFGSISGWTADISNTYRILKPAEFVRLAHRKDEILGSGKDVVNGKESK